MFEQEAEEYAKQNNPAEYGVRATHFTVLNSFKDGAEFGYNKVNEELEEKISVLLSCKNCPENKDGLICQKEYEGKCLAQKIQFIKELKEENAELKEKLGDVQMQKAGEKSDLVWKLKTANEQKAEQLTKAKEIIEELYNIIPASMSEYAKEPMEHARKFMTEE